MTKACEKGARPQRTARRGQKETLRGEWRRGAYAAGRPDCRCDTRLQDATNTNRKQSRHLGAGRTAAVQHIESDRLLPPRWKGARTRAPGTRSSGRSKSAEAGLWRTYRAAELEQGGRDDDRVRGAPPQSGPWRGARRGTTLRFRRRRAAGHIRGGWCPTRPIWGGVPHTALQGGGASGRHVPGHNLEGGR